MPPAGVSPRSVSIAVDGCWFTPGPPPPRAAIRPRASRPPRVVCATPPVEPTEVVDAALWLLTDVAVS
jgi:hypothetical protein